MEIKKVNQVENAIVSRIAASIKSNVTEFSITKTVKKIFSLFLKGDESD